MRGYSLFFGALLIAACLGCGRTPVAKTPPASPPPVTPIASNETPPGETTKAEPPKETPSTSETKTPSAEKNETPADPAKSQTAKSPPAKAESGTSPANDKPAEPVAVEVPDPIVAAGLENNPRERVLLFTAGTPLIVEVIPIIEGRPHIRALAEMVDEALKVADANGDGRTTWDELVASRHFRYGQFGNVSIADERNKREFVRLYDINSDGNVDRDEVPRLLTRNAGGARPFSVRGGGFSPDQSESRAFDLLDADGSGEIDENEMNVGGETLRQRDRNEDDYVAAAELAPEMPDPTAALNDPRGMPMRRRRTNAPDLVRLLFEGSPWEVLQGNMEDAYSLGGKLHDESFPTFPAFFHAMDGDHDGKIKKGEMARLLTMPPQLVIAVRMGNDPPASSPEVKPTEEQPTDATPSENQPAEGQSAEREPAEAKTEGPTSPPLVAAKQPERPSIQILKVDPALMTEDQLPAEGNRLRIPLKTGMIEFYANDQVGGQDVAEQAKTQLATLDGDKNGYLEASEIPTNGQSALMRIEAVDENEDGKVYPEEIERFLNRRAGAQRAQIHARVDYRDDALVAWLDTSRDDRLDHGELRATASRLRQLDRDGDGRVSRDELPDNLYMVFSRGDLQNPAALFALPAARVVDVSGERPRWFTRMDANRDGVINRREFLGELDQFEQLDTDDDNALSWSELKDLK